VKTADEFWSHVARGPECWEWQAARSHGYGALLWGGRIQSAHRVAWVLTNGSIPVGLRALHHCDNPPCVRPDHLFLGTQRDNLRDASSKRRTVFQRHPELRGHGRTVGRPGALNPCAKLTESAVLEIREAYQKGSGQRVLAQRYRVSRDTIRSVVMGHSWLALTGGVALPRAVKVRDGYLRRRATLRRN
jgi:hypothetical protein